MRSALTSNLKNCSNSPYTLLVLFPFLIHRRLACAILSRQSFPYFFVYSVLSGQGWQLTKQVLQKLRSQQEQYTRCCWWKSPEISRRRNRSEIVMNLFSNYLCMNEISLLFKHGNNRILPTFYLISGCNLCHLYSKLTWYSLFQVDVIPYSLKWILLLVFEDQTQRR